MKKYFYEITNAARIIPVNGRAEVYVFSDDEILVKQSETSEQRVRAITLSDTGKATLNRSPMGLTRTVKIILPVGEASEKEFHRQVELLFANANLNV